MLARLRQDSDELSLCSDRESGLVGEFDEGNALFEAGKPSETTNALLNFCEDLETSAQRTSAFVRDLKAAGLLTDGQVSISSTTGPATTYTSPDRQRDVQGSRVSVRVDIGGR